MVGAYSLSPLMVGANCPCAVAATEAVLGLGYSGGLVFLEQSFIKQGRTASLSTQEPDIQWMVFTPPTLEP